MRHKHALDIATAAGGAGRYEGHHWPEALQGHPNPMEAIVTATWEVLQSHRRPVERSPARCPGLRCCWKPWTAPPSARCVPGRQTGRGTCTAAQRQQPLAVHQQLGTAAPFAAELLLPQVSAAASKVVEGGPVHQELLLASRFRQDTSHISINMSHLLGRNSGVHFNMLPLRSCQTCKHRCGCSLFARQCCAACWKARLLAHLAAAAVGCCALATAGPQNIAAEIACSSHDAVNQIQQGGACQTVTTCRCQAAFHRNVQPWP